ncbi:MAG TPA: hypothetical protein PKK94_27235 [Leptospiraceae bacterium]|nr:hypothetical protein [Leptospiraceae bacterium]
MDTAKFLTPVLRFLRNQISLFKAGKVGGKYLNRKQVADSRTGKMKWVYKYKPVSQRGAHEVTGKTFEKKTGGSQEEHKNAVEKALQNGSRVSLHILRDYPDLAEKYGMGKRLEQAKKISSKVTEIKNYVKSESKKPETVNKKDSEVKNVDHVNEYKNMIENRLDYSKKLLEGYKKEADNIEKKHKERGIFKDELRQAKSDVKDQSDYIKEYTKILKDPKMLETKANEWNDQRNEENARNEAKKQRDAKTPLVASLRNKDFSEFKKLINSGKANVSEQDDYGDTAGHYAVFLNEPSLLQKLVDAGANLHSLKNSQGEAVGDMIQQSRNPKMVAIYRKYMDNLKSKASA